MAEAKHVPIDPEAARQLADVIVRRRVELGIRSARALAVESGLDNRTISRLESCRADTVSRTTLAALDINLRLPNGYLLGIVTKKGRSVVELSVPGNASEADVQRALRVAQAAFDAALRG